MKELIYKNKIWIGYSLYCIMLAAALLYLLFPKEELNEYLDATADRLYSGIHFTSEGLSPSLPFGLKLLQSKISIGENPGQILFKANKISIKQKIWSLLTGAPEYYYHCAAYDGDLKGTAVINRDDSNASLSASVEFEDILINKDSAVPPIISDRLEGTLQGNISYEGEKQLSLTQGSGDAILTITNGLIRLVNPILTLEAIDFDEISVKMSLKKGKLVISKAELKGEHVIGILSGTIYLDNDLLESRLDLKGEIEPTAAMLQDVPGAAEAVNLIKKSFKDGKLPTSIKGTIKTPKINWT